MKNTLLPAILILGTLLATNSSSKATAVPVQNFSFESQVLSPGGYTSNDITNWTIATGVAGVEYYTGTAQFNTTNPLAAPAQGNNAIYTHSSGLVYQDVGSLTANTLYTLTIAVGSRKDQGGGLNGGTIQLFNGTSNSGTLLASSLDFVPTAGLFQDLQITYQTGASVSGDLTIAMFQSSGNNTAFDNVRLDAVAVVPESSAYYLFGPALLGLAIVRCKHLRKTLS